MYWTVAGLRQKDSGSWSCFIPLGISDFLPKGAGWGLEVQRRAQNCSVAPREASIPRPHCLYLFTRMADYLGFPRGQTAGSVPVLLSDWTEPSLVLLTHRQAPHNPTKGKTLPQQRTAPPTARIVRPLSRTARPSTGLYKAHRHWPRLAECGPGAHPKCTEGTRAGREKSRVCSQQLGVCRGLLERPAPQRRSLIRFWEPDTQTKDINIKQRRINRSLHRSESGLGAKRL